MNIEQLAMEHGEETFSAISRNENGDAVVGVAYSFTKNELESFAKAYAQQQSEPVAKIIHTKGTGLLEGKTITKVMLDVKYVDLPEGTQLYTQPPNTVSLEQYNKLLDALKSVKSKTSDLHSNENATHLINRLLAVRHIVDFAIVEAERDKEMLSASPTTDTINIDRAEYEAIKADAERYRAIRIFGSGMRVVFGNYPNINIHDVKNNLCGDDLDQAIDQARKV